MRKLSKSMVVGIAFVALAGCGVDGAGDERALGEANQSAKSESESEGKGKSASEIVFEAFDAEGDACSARQCVRVKSSKEISHIDVEAAACVGAQVSYELFVEDGGLLVDTGIATSLVGNDKSCEGLDVDPGALKFDGLSANEYVVCARFEGASVAPRATFVVKAGQTCETETFGGECTLCDGGTGGAGPTATTTTTATTTAETVAAGVGGSPSPETTAVAGVGGSTTASTVAATTATGTGGCEDVAH